MKRSVVRRYRLKRFFRQRRNQTLIALILVFLVADIGLAYYIGWYTTDSKEADAVALGAGAMDIARDGLGHVYVLTAEGVTDPLTGKAFPLSGSSSMAVGDVSGALAVASGGTVRFFPHLSDAGAFNTTLDGDVSLLGIGERFLPQATVPEQVLLILGNSSGEHLIALSIPGGGEMQWSLPLEASVVDIDTAQSCRYFALAFDNGTAMRFSRLEPQPIGVVRVPDEVQEVAMSRDGILMATRFDGRMWLNSTLRSEEVLLEPGAREISMRDNGESVLLRSGDEVLEYRDGRMSTVASLENLNSYLVPSVADRLFLLGEGKLVAYHGDRAGAVWRADVEADKLITDPGGKWLWGISGTTVVSIDNSMDAQGSRDAWFWFGILLLAQGAVLLAMGLKEKIVHAQRDTPYVAMIGTFVGLAVAAAVPWEGVVEWYGSEEAYYIVATAICFVSLMVAWDSLSGLASPFLGVVTGLVAAIPVGLTMAFFLWADGYAFPESSVVFHSILNTIPLGGFMGLVGGTTAYVAQRILRM